MANRVRRSVLVWLVIVAGFGLAAAVVFLAAPGIDLMAAQSLYRGDGRFLLTGSESLRAFRAVFVPAARLAPVLALVLFLVSLLARRPLLMLGPRAWLYLALSLSLAPGLVANLVFKENWGRARPVQIEAFGGEKAFTPALVIADECASNCSFVSGEAASAFALLALAMVARRGRALIVVTTILFGALTGFLRMGVGAHFLSDIVFAAVFSWLTVLGLALILITPFPTERHRPSG